MSDELFDQGKLSFVMTTLCMIFVFTTSIKYKSALIASSRLLHAYDIYSYASYIKLYKEAIESPR